MPVDTATVDYILVDCLERIVTQKGHNQSDSWLAHPHAPYAAPGILTALGAIGLIQNHVGLGLPIDIYSVFLTPPVGHWVLLFIGSLSMVSVLWGAKRKQSHLTEKKKKLDEQKQNLREANQEIDRKRRRMYQLQDFKNQYKGEPKRGQIQDGYIVYAGEARSDDVYAVTKTDEGEIKEASEKHTNKIETALNDESIEWIEERDISTNIT